MSGFHYISIIDAVYIYSICHLRLLYYDYQIPEHRGFYTILFANLKPPTFSVRLRDFYIVFYYIFDS